MKKLIKPRGGGREGRALFTAAGSVENLADSSEFTSDTHTPQPGETSHTHTHTHTQTRVDRVSQRYAHMLAPSSEATGMHTNHLMTTKCGQRGYHTLLLRSRPAECQDFLSPGFLC